jgi:hypothetical protein
MTESKSDAIRSYVERNIIDPARRQGQLEISVVAGAIHSALGLSNRVPLVCQALRSKQLLTRNGLELKKETGPPSGQSTTMVFTYRFVGPSSRVGPTGLRTLVGTGKDLWRGWGGGEAFLKEERSLFQAKE